jgi:hypothetical protein
MSRVIEVIRRGRRGPPGPSGILKPIVASSNVFLNTSDSGAVLISTAPLSAFLPPAGNIADGWSIQIDADGGAITVEANEPINGSATLTVPLKASALIFSTGTAFIARFFLPNPITTINSSQVGNVSNVPGATLTSALNVTRGNYAGRPVITANTTLTAADTGKYIIIGGAGPTLTLPLASAMPAGQTIIVHNYGSAAASVSRQGSDTIEVYGGTPTSLSVPVGGMVTFVSNGTDKYAAHGHALFALGMGQTRQDVTGTRAKSTTYTNTTGRPIQVSITVQMAAADALAELTVGGLVVEWQQADAGSLRHSLSSIVLPGETYRLDESLGTVTVNTWIEVR